MEKTMMYRQDYDSKKVMTGTRLQEIVNEHAGVSCSKLNRGWLLSYDHLASSIPLKLSVETEESIRWGIQDRLASASR